MARPRTIEDAKLLTGAAETLAEVGPSRFTLAKAAARAGVAPATYVKRFGTKQGVFLALNRSWVATIGPGIDAAAANGSRLDRIRAAALWGVAEMDVAEHARNMLATLAMDLQHPDMTDQLAQGWATWRERIAAYVADAVEAGDLTDAPTPEVAARMVFAVVEGTRIAWCVQPDGSLEHRAAQLVDELISRWT